MPLHIIRGDILDVDADAIVISASPNISEGGKLGKLVYEAAGWEEMMTAREKIGRMRPGNAAITPGHKLKTKYVIHTVVPIWNGSDKDEITLRKCYRSSLKLAKETGLQSVAFVLLGSGLCYVPYNKAFEIANETIGTWLEGQESELQVYLVINSVKEELVMTSKAENKYSLSEFHKEELKEYLQKNKSKTREDFDKELFTRYLYKYIQNDKEFGDKILYHRSSVGNLKRDKFKKVKKEFLLAVTIGLIETGLPMEQRFAFIAAGGYSYPVDDRDGYIEDLLLAGKRKFDDINSELYNANPKWGLSRKPKENDENQEKSEKKKAKEKV